MVNNEYKMHVLNKPNIKRMVEQYINRIKYRRKKGQGIPISDYKEFLSCYKKSYEQFKKFKKKFDTSNKSVLEIGSGFGGFMLSSRLEGVYSKGIEPDKDMVKISNKVLNYFDINGKHIKHSEGEKIPFSSNMFDYVVSFQVLEHVKNPEKVIEESLRVLKKGGILYFTFPNYNSFYEGHIEKIWFPFINKENVKIYLKLLGINQNRLDFVNFLKPKDIRLMLFKFDNIKIISLGKKEFKDCFNNNISKIGNNILKNLIKTIVFFKLDKLLIRILIKYDWYYPIILIVEKK